MGSIHCVPVGTSGRAHVATDSCRCGPSLLGLDIATGAIVWRHRDPHARIPARVQSQRTIPIRRPDVPLGRRYRAHGSEIASAQIVDAVRSMADVPGRFSIRRLAVTLREPEWRTREAVIRCFGSAKAVAEIFRNFR